MKANSFLLIFFFSHATSIFAQDFISLSKKIHQATLPYSTSNEFLDVEQFELKSDFAKNGLIPITEQEAKTLIDENLDPLTDFYFGVHRIQLTPKFIGIIYYKQIKIENEEMSSYNFLLTTYSLTGQKLSTIDLVGYEWLEEEEIESNDDIDSEEEQNFEEMEEDLEEIAIVHNDTSDFEEFIDLEVSEQLDEGYAFSLISEVNDEIWIERKSISYYTKNVLATSYFLLNKVTGEFDETER